MEVDKSKFRTDQEKREKKIAERHAELVFTGLKSRQADKIIMEEFKIYAISTVWAIRKRHAARVNSNL